MKQQEFLKVLEAAISFAALAHREAVDKQGEPYIIHPLRVMLAMKPYGAGMIVAVLHDVIEDTPHTLADARSVLVGAGMSSLYEISGTMEALDAISRGQDESYSEYILRCAGNEIACTVKIADIHDNLKRIDSLQHEAERERLRDRYIKALVVLNHAVQEREQNARHYEGEADDDSI